MRRHGYGLVGFVLSSLAGWSLAVAFGAATIPWSGRDAHGATSEPHVPGRTYVTYGRRPVFVPSLSAAVLVRSETYESSDGRLLYSVSARFETAGQAEATLARMLAASTRLVSARSPETRDAATCGRRVYTIFAANQVVDPDDALRFVPSDYAVMRREGNRLHVVYGPSIAHVMELGDAVASSWW